MEVVEKQVYQEKAEFDSKEIQIVPGFRFNQRETIEGIYLRYNSKFKDGDIDDEGDKKYFYNINRNPCKVTTKGIDFDTKHINIMTAAGQDPLKTWYFERDLKYWMKDQNFGQVLNKIFNDLPIYGSVVIKVIDGKPYFIDLRGFVVEQSANTLDQANYIMETHNYTVREYEKWAKKFNWENTEEVLEKHRETDKPYITVFERYGEVLESDNTYTYKRSFIVDLNSSDGSYYDSYQVPSEAKGMLVGETEVDNHPYWEFHMEKIPGRWLGVGVVEMLFEPQIRENELSNQLAKATYFASLHVFQTRGDDVNVNIGQDMVQGQVITSDDLISPVDMVERNLAYFNQETEKWLRNRDEMSFAYDVVQGERSPAGTPLGAVQIAATSAGSYFDQIRETVALSVKEFLYEVIIPQFKKENNTEHVLRIAGEDLDKVRQMIINCKATNALIDFVSRKKKLPTNLQYDAIKASIEERVKQDKEQLLTIPKGFYENIKYKIDIIITGESRDPSVHAQTLTSILQAITVDPTVLTDPAKRKILFKMAESKGINLLDLEPDVPKAPVEELAERTPVRGGGGVSRPVVPPTTGAPVQGEQVL